MVGCLDSHARHPVHKARETGWPCAGPLPLYGVWPHLPDIAAIFYHLLAEVGRSRLCSSRPRYYSEGNRRKTKQRSQGSQPTLTMDIHPCALWALVRVMGFKPTSLAVPNRAFYQLNYTRM